MVADYEKTGRGCHQGVTAPFARMLQASKTPGNIGSRRPGSNRRPTLYKSVQTRDGSTWLLPAETRKRRSATNFAARLVAAVRRRFQSRVSPGRHGREAPERLWVVRNTERLPVCRGPRKGEVLPFISSEINGRSVPVALTDEQRARLGYDWMGEHLPRPAGLETVTLPRAAR